MRKNSIAVFWLVGYSLMILMAGTNIPSPLYSVYQHQMGFSSGIISLIFAVYALVLIPSLLVFGQLSDRFGRKKVLLIGLLIAAAGSATFVFATNLVWLFVARGLQGLAAGMMSGTATAALVELRPDHRKTASLVATIATAGGSGVGPLLGGILAQYAPSPLVLPYIVHIILFIPGFIAILIMSETIKSKSSGSWRLQRPSVPSTIRMPFIMGAVTSFAAWSVMALFMSLLPSYISSLMGIHNLAVTGGVIFLVFVSSAIMQFTLKNLAFQTSMIFGLSLLIIGLAGVLFAVPIQSVLLLMISAIITGFGQGLSFMGSMALVNEVVPESRRGDVVSSLYVIIYTGVGLPVIGIGFIAEWIGLYGAIFIFACFIAVLVILMAILIPTKMKQEMTANSMT